MTTDEREEFGLPLDCFTIAIASSSVGVGAALALFACDLDRLGEEKGDNSCCDSCVGVGVGVGEGEVLMALALASGVLS